MSDYYCFFIFNFINIMLIEDMNNTQTNMEIINQSITAFKILRSFTLSTFTSPYMSGSDPC